MWGRVEGVGMNGCYGFWRFNVCSPALSDMLSVAGLVFLGLQNSLRSGARNEARIVSVVATGDELL